jgi:hypothetical protein
VKGPTDQNYSFCLVIEGAVYQEKRRNLFL